jgi:GNAT superfamily N-acetyltransferase
MADTPESGLKVRFATSADGDALVPLVTAFFIEEGIDAAEAMWRANLAAMIADPRTCFLVAERDGVPVGFASATYTNGIEFGRSAEIEDLFVLGPYRGLGIGRALFEAMLAWARDAGAAMAIVVLTPTGQSDGGLAAFYDAFGFTQSDRRIRYLAL